MLNFKIESENLLKFQDIIWTQQGIDFPKSDLYSLSILLLHMLSFFLVDIDAYSVDTRDNYIVSAKVAAEKIYGNKY